MSQSLKIRKVIGWYMIVSSLFLTLWKVNSLSVDLSQWRAMILVEEFWQELMPFFYFFTLLLAGGSLLWKHRFTHLLLFAYTGFTLEELILGCFSTNAVPFSSLSQWSLYGTVVGGIAGLYLLRKEQDYNNRKYKFRELWRGISFGLGASLLLSLFGC